MSPASGGGTGTPLPPDPGGPLVDFGFWPLGAVRLSTYAKIIGYPEAPFFGVAKAGDPTWACRDIWTKAQRDDIARYLVEAQEDLEGVLGYKLGPTWIVEDQPVKHETILTRWGEILQLGAKAETVLAATASVDHLTDPATVEPLAVSFTDPAEVKVFYPGTDQEIEPSEAEISGGSLTIKIPRVRVVAADKLNNPPTGLDYTVTTNFQSHVEVRRVYANDALTAEIFWQRDDSTSGVVTTTSTAELGLENAPIGRVRLVPTGSIPTTAGNPKIFRLYYRAGLASGNRQAEEMILRLAHSRMAQEPCGCEAAIRIWKRDRFTPEVLTRERYNCPFGLSDGAYMAWTFAVNNQLHRVGVL